MQKMGWFGRLGGIQGHRQCRHSTEHLYDFLFNFNRKYAAIVYRFRHTAQHDSKMDKLLE